jgi:amidase
VWADGHILRPVEGEPGLYRGAVSLSRPRLTDELMIITQNGRSSASLTFVQLPALAPPPALIE